MDRTTDLTSIAGFYDRLSDDYDRMTAFEQRFVKERPFIKLLVDRHAIHTAVDAGTGTGFHALLLARLGVRVTAVDLSPAMIEVLHRHAAAMETQVTGIVARFTELPDRIAGAQDAVFSLGNTLAHAATQDELVASLTAFRRILRPGGVLFLQLLNYRRILAARERIQMVREVGDLRFTRWYAYEGKRVRFNVTREQAGGKEPETISLLLTPFTDRDLKAALETAGFVGVTFHGSIAMEPFSPRESRDCAVLARVAPGEG